MSDYTEDDADRLLAAYLDEVTEEPPDGHRQVGQALPFGHFSWMATKRPRTSIVPVLAAATALVALVLWRVVPLQGGAATPSATSSQQTGLGVLAAPDVSQPSLDSGPWVKRGWADSAAQGLHTPDLVPLLVVADGSQTSIWYRDYANGEQVLAQYDGTNPDSARLLGLFAPSSKLAGASQWEQARVAAAVARDSEMGAALGEPVEILGMSAGPCDGGRGACATARLSGSIVHAPTDAPALAPVALVNLITLEVTLVVPKRNTPEPKGSS